MKRSAVAAALGWYEAPLPGWARQCPGPGWRRAAPGELQTPTLVHTTVTKQCTRSGWKRSGPGSLQTLNTGTHNCYKTMSRIRLKESRPLVHYRPLTLAHTTVIKQCPGSGWRRVGTWSTTDPNTGTHNCYKTMSQIRLKESRLLAHYRPSTLVHMTVIKQCQDQAEGEQAPGALQTPTLAARTYGAHTTVIKP
jgi:hypothetical protein